jgi:phosphotransferase system HPr (HPr) family protein
LTNINSTAYQEVTILNRQGLHARPVMQFVDLASQFSAIVTVSKGDLQVDAKSPMEMMLLEGTCGTRLKLCAHGADAVEAVAALAALVESKFDEE